MDDELLLRLHALPSELLLLIQDLVLGPDSDPTPKLIRMDKSWRPPSTHQINTATRHTHTEFYYTTSIFDFSSADTISSDDVSSDVTNTELCLCARWLNHLPHSSQAKIRHIRFSASYDKPPPPQLNCSNVWRYILAHPNEGIPDPDLFESVQPYTHRNLFYWIAKQTVKIGPHVPEESLPQLDWENAGWRSYSSERVETRVPWYGRERGVWYAWVHVNVHDATRDLLAAVKEEFERFRAAGG